MSKEEIRKEIENLKGNYPSNEPNLCWNCNQKYYCCNCNEIKLLLAQLKGIEQTEQKFEKIIEELDIDKELIDYEGERTEFVRLGMNLFKKELLSKLKGEK